MNGDPFQVAIRSRTTSTGDDDSPDSVEMRELKRRGAKNTAQDYCDITNETSDTVLYDKEIKDEDTLQSIALTHHITIAELKRVNNLMSDQDFHALRYIKVPLKRHGILAERLEPAQTDRVQVRLYEEARPWDVSPDGSNYGDHNDNYEADSDDSSENRALLVRTLSIGDSLYSKKQSRDAKKFLAKMDGDLEKIRNSTISYKPSLEEVTATLTCKRISPMSPVMTKTAWNGADCGIRWWSAVLCVIIVGLLVPLLYFIRYLYSPDS